MDTAYFDSSALMKLLRSEPGTEQAGALWDRAGHITSSRLAYVEVHAAVSASRRNHDLTIPDATLAHQAWNHRWGYVESIELSEPVAVSGGKLADTYALSGADAVHLASALALAIPDLVFATWDRRLHRAATSVGLRVAPAQLPT